MLCRTYVLMLCTALSGAFAVAAQPPRGFGVPGGRGPGGPGGPDFFGPPGMQERKILKEFDTNGDGWLNREEREVARAALKKMTREGGRGVMRFGPPGGFGSRGPETKPGPKVQPTDVRVYANEPLYDGSVLRTFFLTFENADWEAELEDFHGTDVDVPATLIVDGKTYPNVGVHFRGMSSYMGVRAGQKRSLNLALDLADSKQRLLGYKTLNLLNSHDDATFMNSVLYSHIGRQYLPVPKANFAKVVINGESWGVYANVQQFNKEFLNENYKTTKGARWKVRGSPGARGGLEYLGDRIDDYRIRYEIKSSDHEKSWQALINLCKVLNQTPADQLEAALRPILDVDELLWFLALDVALINSDGYWTRASDYSIYLDPKGKFHILPHDFNEAFRPAHGPGGGGPGGPQMMAFPRPGELLPAPLVKTLQLTPEQIKQLETLQKEVDAKVERLLTEKQRQQLQELRAAGPGGFGPPGGGPGGMGRPGGGFGPPGGPGGFGPPPEGGPVMIPLGAAPPGAGSGFELDPLVGLTDNTKPLRSKVLAVPNLRTQYLKCIHTIAARSLDWQTLGPVVAQYRQLIDKEVQADTRKLTHYEAFVRTTADDPKGESRGRDVPLRTFAEQRRKFLLNHPEVKKVAP